MLSIGLFGRCVKGVLTSNVNPVKKYLIGCILGNCFLSSADFSKLKVQEYDQSVKQFRSRSGPTFCQACFGSRLVAKIVLRCGGKLRVEYFFNCCCVFNP